MTNQDMIPSDMKVVELRQALSERDLSTKGLKKDLVARLEEALAADSETNEIDVVNETPAPEEPSTNIHPESFEIVSEDNSHNALESTSSAMNSLPNQAITQIQPDTPKNAIQDDLSSNLEQVESNKMDDSETSLKKEEVSTSVSEIPQKNNIPEKQPSELTETSQIINSTALKNETSTLKTTALTVTENIELSEAVPKQPLEVHDMQADAEIQKTVEAKIVENKLESDSLEDAQVESISEEKTIKESSGDVSSVPLVTVTETSEKITTTLSEALPSENNQIVSTVLEAETKQMETDTTNSTHKDNEVEVQQVETKPNDLINKNIETGSEPMEIEVVDSTHKANEATTIEDEAVSFQSSPNHDISINFTPEVANESQSESQEPKVNSSGEPLKFIAITNLTRPFPLGDFEEQLREYGSITQFWIDKFRSHCYVQYENSEGASLCKSQLAGVQFPPDTGKKLDVALLDDTEGLVLLQKERSSSQRFILALQGDKPELQEYNDVKKPLARGPQSARRSLPHDAVQNEDRKRQHISLPPQLPLDKLFSKTTTKPCLYFKPNKPLKSDKPSHTGTNQSPPGTSAHEPRAANTLPTSNGH